MLGSEPGETLSQLTVDGLPRIIRVASAYLVPLVSPYLEPESAVRLIDDKRVTGRGRVRSWLPA
jgi:hypothetical protein